MKPQEIVAIAREVIGTPYHHQGRVAGTGLDCVGLAVYVAQRVGMHVQDVYGYSRQPNPGQMRAAIDRHLVRMAKEGMQAGDVAWITFTADPQHLGVVGDYVHGGLSLIHAYNSGGIREVVEHRLDDAWYRRIVAVWRFPGVMA